MSPMCDHFGIGLRSEYIAAALELLTQLFVVLDDAVVDERQPVARDVRVGVAFTGDAMRGPARVGDAEVAAHRFALQGLFECAHLAHGTLAHEMPAVCEYRNAGRIVAAVFESLQSFDED